MIRKGYASRKQAAAHREICRQRHEQHMREAYGMLPIKARFPGKCGCGRIFGEGSGWAAGTPCRFDSGDQIAKRNGVWWNLVCIDRVKWDEFRATARFVLETEARKGWYATAWTNDEAEAERWKRNCTDLAEICPEAPKERVTDRKAA